MVSTTTAVMTTSADEDQDCPSSGAFVMVIHVYSTLNRLAPGSTVLDKTKSSRLLGVKAAEVLNEQIFLEKLNRNAGVYQQ